VRRGWTILVSIALIPLLLGAGAALGYFGVLLSHGNGWFVVIGLVPAAFLVGVWAPHRWAAPAVAALLLGGYWIAAYGDGDDACEGRPDCEDNIGAALTFAVPVTSVLVPMVAGAIVQPRNPWPLPWSSRPT
jgi:hypothetical protein